MYQMLSRRPQCALVSRSFRVQHTMTFRCNVIKQSPVEFRIITALCGSTMPIVTDSNNLRGTLDPKIPSSLVANRKVLRYTQAPAADCGYRIAGDWYHAGPMAIHPLGEDSLMRC
jgi:hypothetical protein